MSFDAGYFAPSPVRTVSRYVDKRTKTQVVAELGLRVGQAIQCPDGITREIKKISSNGDVFVKGVRAAINVHAIQKM